LKTSKPISNIASTRGCQEKKIVLRKVYRLLGPFGLIFNNNGKHFVFQYKSFFFVFIKTAMLLIKHQNIIKHMHISLIAHKGALRAFL